MLTAIILVCSVTITPELSNCNRTNALQVLKLPEETANPFTCLMHGQAYLAGTAIGRELRENERVKVMCVRAGDNSERASRAD